MYQVNLNNSPNEFLPVSKYLELVKPVTMNEKEMNCLIDELNPQDLKNILITDKPESAY